MSRCIVNDYIIDECIIVKEINSITITLNNKNACAVIFMYHIFEMFVDLDHGYVNGVTILTIRGDNSTLFTPSIALPPIHRDDSIEFTFKSQSNSIMSEIDKQ